MRIPLDEETIIKALKKVGVIPQDMEVRIKLEIPRGGDYSGMKLEADEFEEIYAEQK